MIHGKASTYNRGCRCDECKTARKAGSQQPRHKKVQWRYRLKHFHNMTEEDYDHMFATQKGKCAICQNRCKTGRRLAVDHCHQTKLIRGLLCMRCNTNLGWVEKFSGEIAAYLRGEAEGML